MGLQRRVQRLSLIVEQCKVLAGVFTSVGFANRVTCQYTVLHQLADLLQGIRYFANTLQQVCQLMKHCILACHSVGKNPLM